MKKRVFSYLASALFCCMMLSCGSAEVKESLPRGKTPQSLSTAVDSFVAATETEPQSPDHITLHSVMVLKHGHVIYEKWLNDAGPDIPHVMHSVSKTFTSIAVGMAIEEGKLHLDDKVIAFFPDQLPDEVSDNLAAMTVRDLLTMTCGQNTQVRIDRTESDTDWVKAFLAHSVEHEPGTYYLYNSYGSYMLSAILQKVTGETTLDYLNTRLFEPLYISKPKWETSPQGISCGGWGLYIKTEDMAKVGQLLLQKGKWNGQQIISEEWVKEMSSYQVPSAPSGTPFERLAEFGLTKENNDWVQGYGYQMWLCRYGGYRADGANGQYIIVLPEKDAVIVLTTDSNLYQPYLDMVWKYLLPAV